MVQVHFKLIKAGLDLLTSSSVSILNDENWVIEAWNILKVRFISVSYVMLIKTGIRQVIWDDFQQGLKLREVCKYFLVNCFLYYWYASASFYSTWLDVVISEEKENQVDKRICELKALQSSYET